MVSQKQMTGYFIDFIHKVTCAQKLVYFDSLVKLILYKTFNIISDSVRQNLDCFFFVQFLEIKFLCK